MAPQTFAAVTGGVVIGTGMTPVTAAVNEPTVKHYVLMKDFARWLKRNGRSPAETASRSALRKQLGI